MQTLLIHSILLVLGAFLVTYYLMPKIIIISEFKNLHSSPNERSSHVKSTPNIGGSAFFIVLMLSFYFSEQFDDKKIVMSIIPSLTILFIAGLKDDLVVLAPLSKLIAQIAAALFLVFHYQYNIESLHGFMGIEGISIYITVPVAVLIVVSIINAVNLIDGIDGLAATVGIIMFTVFASLFYLADNYFLMLTCLVMIGSLFAFLRFNLSKTQKIFMGDTGSMIIGFMLGLMTVRLLAMDVEKLAQLPFYYENLPFVVAAILIIPLFDTARVFTLRILKKKSPFAPDRTHIHHLIIDYYQISHRRASFYIGVANFLFIAFFSFLAMRTNQWVMLAILLHVIFGAVVFFFVLNRPRILRKIKILAKRRFRSINLF